MKYTFRIPFKIFLCYSITVLVIIFGWSTGGTHLLKHQVRDNIVGRIYDELKVISDNYITGTYGSSLANDHLNKHISVISNYLNVRILVVRKDGSVTFDTDNIGGTDSDINLFEYDSNILSQTISDNVSIEGFIDREFTSVSFPITYNLGIRGYLIGIVYENDIYSDADSINAAFWPYILIIIIVATLAYVFIYYMLELPINKTIKAAREFSNHNYEAGYRYKHHDEFKELNDIINIMASDLENLEEYQKTFISNISHDFRSPLTSIRGYTEAMIDGTIPPELHEKYINIIKFESERLTKLTENLLTLGNMDSRRSLDITDFDINLVIKQISISFEGACKNKQIKLIFDEPATIVSADYGKIQQILYNLIDNAIKFTKAEGVIQISTKVKNDKVFVSVKDNGIGIPKDSLGKIWDRFYKTDLSRGKDKKGTGLGLSIVKEIISAHGENINVTSTVDVGTEFTFSLPYKSA